MYLYICLQKKEKRFRDYLTLRYFPQHVVSEFFSYWGSFEVNIPGGSGSGNAVQDLKLYMHQICLICCFQQEAICSSSVYTCDSDSTSTSLKPVLRQAPLPASQPAPQVRPAPQPQQLRVFQAQPANRQQQRQRPAQIRQPVQIRQPAQKRKPAQLRQPAQIRQQVQIRQPVSQPSPAEQQPTAVQPTQRFQNFAARTEERRPSPVVRAQPSVDENEVDTEKSKDEAVINVSDLSRFQLYQLRQKLKLHTAKRSTKG